MIKNTEENKKSAAEKEAEVREVLQQLNSKLLLIGNLVHDSVPVDNDEVLELANFISFLLYLMLILNCKVVTCITGKQ